MKVGSSIPSVNTSPSTSIRTNTLPIGELKQRDVVILNPYMNGGGDKALGNKVANIVLNDGGRVSIISMDADDISKADCRNLSLNDPTFNSINHLRNPLLIFTPVSTLEPHQIEFCIKRLNQYIDFNKQKIMILDEMDVLPRDSKLPECINILRQNGFQKIHAYSLGLNNGIGYLATEQKQIDDIKHRFKNELSKLMDSYNLSLAKDTPHYLAYLSAEPAYRQTKLPMHSAQLFVANKLIETHHDNKDANFIIVLRQLANCYSDNFDINEIVSHKKYYFDGKETVSAALQEILTKKETEKFDLPKLFAKAQLYFADAKNGKLEKLFELKGTGNRQINIVVTEFLPKNIFEDFMCLADSGMMSGDQSLSEYLSLKNTVPYYDMPPWKEGVAEGLIKHAKKYGTEDAMMSKISGYTLDGNIRAPYLNAAQYIPPSPNQLAKEETTNKEIASLKANDKIREFITPRNEWEKWDQWKANQHK
ncbi:hypothetical protein NFC79_19585 [Providencia stuartii]|nr:hypothetical protein NFC79_19585 [Providencia stuartii]